MDASRNPADLKPLWILLTSVAVVASSVVGAVAVVLPRAPLGPPPPLRIDSVTFSPSPPAPDQPVLITARISGGGYFPTVDLEYAAAFASGESGGGTMTANGQGGFEKQIGPFPSGTEVWFVVGASRFDAGPVLSNVTVFQVGSVPRGGPSDLRIASVIREPTNPSDSELVTVTANVSSNATWTNATLAAVGIGRSGTEGATERMIRGSGSNYSAQIPPSRLTGPEVVVLYRVTAQDSTGNTAVSQMFTYRIPRPVPVP